VPRRASRRRALSPLVSSVVLISAAVIGGVIVYNYFQSNINSIAAATGSLQVSADYTYINSTTKMVYLEVLNTYRKPVTLTGVKVVFTNGSIQNVNIEETTVDSGSKGSVIVSVPSEARILYLVYTIDGRTMYSNPIKVS
jgi:hypothetical protein